MKESKRDKTVSLEELLPDWERQKGESAKSYEAFCEYRDLLNDRSIKKVAEKLDKSTTLIGRWSSKHNWVERVEKYDLYLDAETRKKREKAIIDMKDRHATIATAMLTKASKALLKIPEDEIKPLDIARMVEVGSKLERLSRGESTENVEQKTELTGKDGGPIETKSSVVIFKIPDNGRDPK